MNYPLYNDELCPDLWDRDGDEYTMKKEVRERLMEIANDFVDEYLVEADLKLTIEDVILIGSSTNYNWTPYSDMDLHILVDYDELGIGDKFANIMLTAIKINWNKAHEIEIKGHAIEVYVQGTSQDVESVSIYSVQDDKWLEKPCKETPKFNKKLIVQKYKLFRDEIEEMMKNADEEKIMKMLDKLYEFRQKGLDTKKGEFSEENLVFKILRAQGYLDKMKKYAAEIYDKEMTLAECKLKLSRLKNMLSNKAVLTEGVERSLRQGITPTMGHRRWSLPYGGIPETEPLEELAYKGNMGAMEIMKFYNMATPEQEQEFEQLAVLGNSKEAWLLVQAVTGIKLVGNGEFGTPEELKTYKMIKNIP